MPCAHFSPIRNCIEIFSCKNVACTPGMGVGIGSHVSIPIKEAVLFYVHLMGHFLEKCILGKLLNATVPSPFFASVDHTQCMVARA